MGLFDIFKNRKRGTFEIYKDNAGEFRWRLKSANGEIIAISEGYKQINSAYNCIAAIREIAAKSNVKEI